MNTFFRQSQIDPCQQRKIQNSTKTLNKTKSQCLTLTERGLRQAHRNDSTEIWKLFYSFQQQTQAQSCNQSKISQNPQQIVPQFKRSSQKNQHLEKSSEKQNQGSQKFKSNKKYRQNQKLNKQFPKSRKRSNNFQQAKDKNAQKLNKQSNEQKSLLVQQQQSYLKKMNIEIAKYLEEERYCTRNLSNTAFAKLYNRPCLESYGYKNTSSQSFSTKNLLKTHNITPHTLQNRPQTYQSYKNAIIHAKRTKLNMENNEQRIRRQFLKFFDDSLIQGAQTELRQINKEKKAKSLKNLRSKQISFHENYDQNQMNHQKQKRKSLKELLNSNQPIFLYKYKQSDGSTRLSRDRHGISCYVDSSYSANNEALIKFQKNLNPILPEKIKQEDINLDQIRKQNYHKSIDQSHPSHYMIPCVVTPYDKNKYNFRNKRASSVVN